MSRTKLFLVLYFLLPWIASLLQWGDDRTSAEFLAAPPWFFILKQIVQALSIILLFLPPRPRDRPSLLALFFAVATIVSLLFTTPIIEAEHVLINSSIQIALVAAFLSIFKPSVNLDSSDFALLFYMFLAGFALQFFLYLQFGIIPSHSLEDVFLRFNGITNDSLATAFILSLIIPWAASSRFGNLKVLTLIGMSFATGSLFAVVFVPAVTIAYLLYKKIYQTVAILIVIIASAALYFYDVLMRAFEFKFISIIAHLSFFLDISGESYYKSVSCSEEFCESFVESGFHLSAIYVVAFYALLLCFIVPLFRSRRWLEPSSVNLDALRIYGGTLLVGSLVHPVPLIPMAVPLFLVLASLYSSIPPIRYRPSGVITGYIRPVTVQ